MGVETMRLYLSSINFKGNREINFAAREEPEFANQLELENYLLRNHVGWTSLVLTALSRGKSS
jgi:hypothetical protein